MTSPVELLFEALDESRERLLVAIEPLSDDALLTKHAVGEWSIADVLTNFTAWESELVTGLLKIDQGKRPDKLLSALLDPTRYDEDHYTEMQDRDLDQIFEDLQQVRIQVEDWLSAFSERDLMNPRRYHWFNKRSLRDVIAETTFRREEKYLPAIESFAEAWQAKQSDLADNMIPLTLATPLTEEEQDDGTN